jgi:uridine kinase
MQVGKIGLNTLYHGSAPKNVSPNLPSKPQAGTLREVCSKEAANALRAAVPIHFHKNNLKTNPLYSHYKKVLNETLEMDRNSKNPYILDVKDGLIDKIALKMAEHPEKPIMIAVTGESASGKSSFKRRVEEFAQKNDAPITFLETDNYFKDISGLIEKYGSYTGVLESGYDVDSPDNIYIDDLKQNLADLAAGKDTKGRKYMMDGTGKSFKDAIDIKANRIVLVEGVAAMLPGIDELFDAKIYTERSEDMRKERLMRRAPSRGQSPEEALVQWEKTKEAGKKYVQPLKKNCDVVVNNDLGTKPLKKLLKKMLELKNVPTIAQEAKMAQVA